jgi:hypothetical protein
MYTFKCITVLAKSKINVRENRRGNQEWTIQRHWQLKDEQHGPHQKPGVNPGELEG